MRSSGAGDMHFGSQKSIMAIEQERPQLLSSYNLLGGGGEISNNDIVNNFQNAAATITN